MLQLFPVRKKVKNHWMDNLTKEVKNYYNEIDWSSFFIGVASLLIVCCCCGCIGFCCYLCCHKFCPNYAQSFCSRSKLLHSSVDNDKKASASDSQDTANSGAGIQSENSRTIYSGQYGRSNSPNRNIYSSNKHGFRNRNKNSKHQNKSNNSNNNNNINSNNKNNKRNKNNGLLSSGNDVDNIKKENKIVEDCDDGTAHGELLSDQHVHSDNGSIVLDNSDNTHSRDSSDKYRNFNINYTQSDDDNNRKRENTNVPINYNQDSINDTNTNLNASANVNDRIGTTVDMKFPENSDDVKVNVGQMQSKQQVIINVNDSEAEASAVSEHSESVVIDIKKFARGGDTSADFETVSDAIAAFDAKNYNNTDRMANINKNELETDNNFNNKNDKTNKNINNSDQDELNVNEQADSEYIDENFDDIGNANTSNKTSRINADEIIDNKQESINVRDFFQEKEKKYGDQREKERVINTAPIFGMDISKISYDVAVQDIVSEKYPKIGDLWKYNPTSLLKLRCGSITYILVI